MNKLNGSWVLGATDQKKTKLKSEEDHDPNRRFSLVSWLSLFVLQEKTDKIPITVSMHICDSCSYKHTQSYKRPHAHTSWRGTCLNDPETSHSLDGLLLSDAFKHPYGNVSGRGGEENKTNQ